MEEDWRRTGRTEDWRRIERDRSQWRHLWRRTNTTMGYRAVIMIKNILENLLFIVIRGPDRLVISRVVLVILTACAATYKNHTSQLIKDFKPRSLNISLTYYISPTAFAKFCDVNSPIGKRSAGKFTAVHSLRQIHHGKFTDRKALYRKNYRGTFTAADSPRKIHRLVDS